nr:AMP-binding protein [Fodinicola feengrottensis]
MSQGGVRPDALGLTVLSLLGKENPAAIAVESEAGRLTYEQLDLRVNRLARYLRGLGAGPETYVAIMLPRSIDLVVAILAVLRAGAAYVPIDPEYPAERIRFVLADSGSRLLLTDRSQPNHGDLTTVFVDDLAVGAQPVDPPTVLVRPENAAYVIYTSGSTGQPKGVVVSHAAIAPDICAGCRRLSGSPPMIGCYRRHRRVLTCQCGNSSGR